MGLLTRFASTTWIYIVIHLILIFLQVYVTICLKPQMIMFSKCKKNYVLCSKITNILKWFKYLLIRLQNCDISITQTDILSVYAVRVFFITPTNNFSRADNMQTLFDSLVTNSKFSLKNIQLSWKLKHVLISWMFIFHTCWSKCI